MTSVETLSDIQFEILERNNNLGVCSSSVTLTDILLTTETVRHRSYIDNCLPKEMLQDTSPNARVTDVPKKATPKSASTQLSETPAQKRWRYKQLKKLRRAKRR